MERTLVYGLILAGTVLMVVNIVNCVRFTLHVRSSGSWEKERTVLIIPVILLVLFLIGYLIVGIFGKPDAVIAGILFGGSIYVAVNQRIMRRITDRIRQNEHLEAELEAARRASESKSFFLSNMSHDIRTPLNAVIGFTALAGKEGTAPDVMRSYLRKINASGRQLLSIVDDVLEMSRIESGRIELVPGEVSLREIVLEAADVIDGPMQEKGIDFTVQCGSLQDDRVICDRNRLNRALMNILSNACKFTGEGGKVVMTLVQTGSSPVTGSYEISIKDTGIGMDPGFVQHIFAPFERERTSSVSRIHGTGLGMAITKSIIDMMGGSIEINTEPGKGSEFIIGLELPVAQKTEDAGAATDPAGTVRGMASVSDGAGSDRAGAGSALQGLRVLLVEDNEVNREIACAMLDHAGIRYDIAVNGQEAVYRTEAAGAADSGYDLILMDIQMPEMDGYAATRMIRASSDRAVSETPIIAMTANALAEDREAAAETGMQGHIAKPLDEKNMLQTILDVMGLP